MKKEIKFNSFYTSNNYTKNLEKLFANYELFRQKHFSSACVNILQAEYPESSLLLTHSATGALEMIAIAIDIEPGDEIILPSYTFVSTANAFALRGAKLVFVDIELDGLGVDPKLVEQAITDKTKAIVCIHYAGHPCKLDELLRLKQKHNLFLIEDAAMAYGSTYKDRAIGTIGDFGVISFDVTKHMSATQGGCLLVNNSSYAEKLLSIYHLGTNRDEFERNKTIYYEWIGLGSKYQMPEINAAILVSQLKARNEILNKRKTLSKHYYKGLSSLIPSHIRCIDKELLPFNFHEFYIICRNKEERINLENYLKDRGVEVFFHYIPLHNSAFGSKFTYIHKDDKTTLLSDTLLRLPLHTHMEQEDVDYVCKQIKMFFNHV